VLQPSPRITRTFGGHPYLMRLPSRLLPVIVIAFVAIRIIVAIQVHAENRKRNGKGWFESVPIWTKGLWVLIGIAVVVLICWAPKNPKPTAPNKLLDPTSKSVTPPGSVGDVPSLSADH
jgi:hypothetical protein